MRQVCLYSVLFILIFVNLYFFTEPNGKVQRGDEQRRTEEGASFNFRQGCRTSLLAHSDLQQCCKYYSHHDEPMVPIRRGENFTAQRPARFTIVIMIADRDDSLSARNVQISSGGTVKTEMLIVHLIIYRGIVFNCTRTQYTRRVSSRRLVQKTRDIISRDNTSRAQTAIRIQLIIVCVAVLT